MRTETQPKHTRYELAVGKCGNDADQYEVYDTAGRTVAVTHNDEGGGNAHLFAAAPELIDVAREIEAAWGDGETGDWRGALDKALRMARAAIAKAEGREGGGA